MTDVNIAMELLKDAYDDAFDTAMLVSADSDLTTPVTTVRGLESCAHAYFRIGRKKLLDSQFPDQVIKPDGYVLRRPSTWR